MTEAVLDLDEHTNYVLNIIKERYNLKDISEANNLMALQYEEKIREHAEDSPEFIAEMLELKKGSHIRIPDDMSLLDYIRSLPDEEDD